MARSIPYIGIRGAQFVLAIVVMGIAGFLLSDIKKATYYPGVAGWNSAGDAFNVGGVPASMSLSSFGSSLDSKLSGSGSGSSVNLGNSPLDKEDYSLNHYAALSAAAAAQHEATMNIINNIKRKRSLFRRSPKGGKKSSVGSSSRGSSNSSSSSLMKYKVPLNMLIAVSVFTILTAIVSIVLNFLWPSWAIYVFWFYVPWDLFLAILWIAAAGLTGRFLTQYSGWKADFKQAHLFKTCFALALLFMLSFIATAVLAFLICWRSRKNKAEAEPGVENAPVDTTAAGAVAPASYEPEKGPPIYSNETAPAPQAYYDPQQQQPQPQQPYQPSVSPLHEAPHSTQPAPPMQPGYHQGQ